ncbi:YciI family protein [Rhizobium terrae]|uniref:YciI family protein n=1 Tax=Rhizobium terrae TaxID=2171756 RepID=UPI0029C06977|nr:YciI family protein [Rhizobium terrae]
MLDGPYSETKEQLGGYYLIEAPDLDAALEWASKCPAAVNGTIEVRPLWVI